MNNFYDLLYILNLPNSTSFGTDLIILNSISCFLLFAILKVIITESNIVLVSLSSLVSILLVILYLAMDAPDVAMTEASVNVCLSTLISLAALKKIEKHQILLENNSIQNIFGLFLCTIIAVFFIYISLDLKDFGAPWAGIHHQVGKFYIENTMKDIGIESIVCAILASYRGLDTMGETAVIAAAVISMLYISSIDYKEKDNV